MADKIEKLQAFIDAVQSEFRSKFTGDSAMSFGLFLGDRIVRLKNGDFTEQAYVDRWGHPMVEPPKSCANCLFGAGSPCDRFMDHPDKPKIDVEKLGINCSTEKTEHWLPMKESVNE